jgi:chromosome segregation ATPase
MRPALFILLAALAFGVLAQDKKAQDATRRLQAANQRLFSEKAQLEREKGELAKKLGDSEKASADADKRLKTEKGALARTRNELKALEAEKTALQERLAETERREAALKVSLAETQKQLAQASAQGEQLAKRVGHQKDTIGLWQEKTAACENKNGELAKLGYELAGRYRAKTCTDISLENEPFTGIGRARMENLLEDYKDRVRAQQFDARREPIKQGASQ